MKKYTILLTIIIMATGAIKSQINFESEIHKINNEDLEIFFIGHGTLMFKYNNKVMHIDPVSYEADYSKMPKADIVLITHHHGDHFDIKALDNIVTENTDVILTRICAKSFSDGIILENGEKKIVQDILIEAIPAYNIVHMRSEGNPYHPKGDGNGYIITLGGKRIFIAGDTENTPEIKALKDIDIAFLPMNLPYTMSPEMVANAAKAFKPKILYPYHYGDTDTSKLIELLKEDKDIEVRVKKM